MQFTARDIKLLYWINSIGFVTVEHIATKFNITKQTTYRRIKTLVDNNYLIHERIFHGMQGAYRVSKDGVAVSQSELPRLRRINLANYHHDVIVTNLSLLLVERHGGEFMPERLLRHEMGVSHFGKQTHICDGVLSFDNKRIAIEVELNKKSKKRRETIFNRYVKNLDYDQVWYFCNSEEVERQLIPYTQKIRFLQIYKLSDFLSEESNHVTA